MTRVLRAVLMVGLLVGIGSSPVSAEEPDPIQTLLEAYRRCNVQQVRLQLWGLPPEQAWMVLEALPGLGIQDVRLEAGLLARIGGHEAASLGLALLDASNRSPEQLTLRANLEAARQNPQRALQLYREAEQALTPESPKELQAQIATRLTELYLLSTPNLERALPSLRRAIGLAYGLGREEEIRHLQELQQLFALQYSRLKARPDALRFVPVDSHRGLLSSDARALVRQGDGVWVLDGGGAAYFDGTLWKAYPSKEVFGYGALLGSDGALYASPMNGGLAKLVDGNWSLVEEPKGYETNPIPTLLEFGGWLYTGRPWGVSRMPMSGGPFEPVPIEGLGWARKLDLLGDRLVATGNQSIFVEDKGRWEKFPIEVGATLGTSAVQGNAVWIPTTNGVYRWEDGQLQAYGVSEGLPTNEMNLMLTTADGGLYAVSTHDGTLAQFDGEVWQGAPEATAVIDFEAMPETLLAATEGGLLRGRSKRWRILDSRSGLPGDQVEYALRHADEMWLFAQTKGIARLKDGQTSVFNEADGLPALTYFNALAGQERQRWIGTGQGLFRLQGEQFVEVPLDGALGSEVFSLLAAEDRQLLVGTTQGLLLLDEAGNSQRIELPSPVVRAIAALDGGRYLVASEGAGVVRLGRNAAGHLSTQKIWGPDSGLCSDQAQAIWAADPNEIWVGTNSGLAVWRPTDSEEGQWKCLTEANGLPGHDITSILRLSNGHLAVAFYLVGIGIFDGQNWSLFGTTDGLPSAILWSLAEPEPGVLWAGTGKGVWELKLDSRPPRTFLELNGILYTQTAEGRLCEIGPHQEAGEESLVPKLRIGQRDYIPFETTGQEGCPDGRPAGVTALTQLPVVRALAQSPWGFEDPESLWYSFRIDDGSASPFKRGTALSLPELEDGTHTLSIQAKNRWLVVEPNPISIRFQLDRPVSGWVMAAVGGGILLILFLLRAQIRDTFLRLRHARFQPIPKNPYTPKTPAPAHLLVGREALLEKWMAPSRRPDAMSESRLLPGHLSLGKTSVLEEFQRQAQAAGQIAVSVNLAEWMQSSFTKLMAGLCGKLPGVASASEENPIRQLDQELERIGKMQPLQRVYLLLDNFQLIDQLLAANDTPLQQVVLALRSLLQRHRHLSLIAALSGENEHLKGRYAELYFFSTLDMLGLLPPEATERLCTQPLQGLVYFAPAAVSLIHRLSGGHPAVLQVVLYALVEKLSAAKTNVCNVAFVREAIPGLIEEAVALGGWWQALTRPQQLVLALAAERMDEGAALDITSFTEAESNRMGLLAQEARRALLGCVHSLLLTGDEHEVRWGAELFRLWIRAKQPFKTVLERERMQVGPYELLSKVGQGGMGVVYRGRHLTGGEIVAVKVLNSGALDDEESRHRFFREAEIGIRLRHNNIVMIHEKGEYGGQAYLAMEFLEGTTLRGYVRDKGPMGAKAAMKILRASTDALQAIHELGIIHRDIKSENIFLQTPQGTKKTVPKLMDFGLARSETSRVTRTGVIVGTVAYMSPEQALGQKLGPTTDLYSMGVVLFEMLTGQMPFSGPSDVVILSQVVHRPPPDIRQLRPDIPDALAQLLEVMLSKEASNRPRSASEVVAALDSILGTPGEAEPAANGVAPKPGT